MKISLIVEGKTEKAFVPKLRDYLQLLLPGKMPNLHVVPQNGRIPSGEKLDKLVESLLSNGKNPADHVIVLTDVYPDYLDAAKAKAELRESVKNRVRFHAHAAQYEFEAWLLPYWDRIQILNQYQGGICISGRLTMTARTPRHLISPLGPNWVGTGSAV